MVLFGFPTRDERDTFEALIGATGVGPKLALAILSVHTPSMLRRCLADDDLDALMLVPGVGKRTAQRLLVELKSRLEVPDLDLTAVPGAHGDAARRGARRARPGSATRPKRCATCSASSPTTATVEDLLRDALAVAVRAGGRRMREELLSPTADPVEAAEETTLRPRGSTSSSASPACASTSRSC